MIHDEADRLLAAGAVLDDLGPVERAAYDAHRADCLACRRLETELDHVLADLALVVPDRVPPPDLLAGILATMRADGGSPAPWPVRTVALAPASRPAGSARMAGSSTRRGSRGPVLAAVGLAAALGLVAVGLGVRGVALQADLQASTARVAALEAALTLDGEAVTVASHPRRIAAELHGDALAPEAEAVVVYLPGTTSAYLVARGLPATAPGHGYQLWVADDAGAHPLQVVGWDGAGTLVVPIGVDLAESAAVMLTLEATGGATGAPGPQVVFGEL